jgi:predicted ATP-grasp superfamily ATP-dependent carboligase
MRQIYLFEEGTTTTNFYYVYKVGGGRPTFHHPTFEQAVSEAQRLVDSVGGEYEILEARAIVKAAPKYVIETLNPSPRTPYHYNEVVVDDPPF